MRATGRRNGATNVFNDSPDFVRINSRQHPDPYRVGKGEQGVLLVEPDNGELLPNWRVPPAAALSPG